VLLDLDDCDSLVKIYVRLSNVDYVQLLLIDHDHDYFQQHHVVDQHVFDAVDDVAANLLFVVLVVLEQLRDFQ
jgi:hypothetical protein